MGGAIATTRRVLLLAVRTARQRGWAAAEERCEIATHRTGRVRAAMLGFGVSEGTEWTDGDRGRAPMEGVAEPPALGALGGFGVGEYFVHCAVSGEEVD